MPPDRLEHVRKFCFATFVGSLLAATYCGPLVLVAWFVSTLWLFNWAMGFRTRRPKKRVCRCRHNSQGDRR